jgi:ABC-type polysaccharide/polyol phosphate transport system ATPase subunit
MNHTVIELRAKINALFNEISPYLRRQACLEPTTHKRKRKTIRRRYKLTRAEYNRMMQLIVEFAELNDQLEAKNKKKKPV